MDLGVDARAVYDSVTALHLNILMTNTNFYMREQ